MPHRTPPTLTQQQDGALMGAMRRRFRPLALLLALLLAAALLNACGSSPKPSPKPPHAIPATSAATGPPPLAGPPALPARTLALLGDGDVEPLVERRGERGLLVAAVAGRWLVAPFASGHPAATLTADSASELLAVATAPSSRSAAALTRSGDGYLLAWAAVGVGSNELKLLLLDADGNPKGEPQTGARSQLPIRWLAAFGSPEPRVLLWEVGHDEGRRLWAAGLRGGALLGASELARGIIGWHATETATGAAVAVVTGAENGAGKVALATIDEDGHASQMRALGDGSTAFADVQVAATKRGLLAAWTDNRGDDPHIYLGRIPLDGGEAVVAPALAPVGPQALVALVTAGDGRHALLAWERTIGAAAQRRIELQGLDADGKPTPLRAAIAFHGEDGLPQLAADGDGYAAITLAPMRALVEPSGVPSARVAPHFVRLDGKLALRGSEPLRIAQLGGDGVPHSVHGLSCRRGRCTAIASGSGRQRALVLVELPLRPSPWHPPSERLPAAGPPQAAALETVAELGQAVADVASTKLADGRTLVAWISHSADTVKDRAPGPAPGSATVAYRLVERDGSAGVVKTLTERATSIGGVALAALPEAQTRSRGKPVAVIAWAGKRGGDSQVFAAKIGRRGSVVSERSVTKIKRRQKNGLPNEVFDIDVVADGKGNFLCAWSDTRDGDPEIYVARINANLQKTLIDKRVTHAKGPSTEVRLQPLPNDRTAVVWSDARDGERHADVYLRLLDTGSLTPRAEERRLHRSPGHSRTPQLAAAGAEGMMAYWIEEAENEGGGAVQLLALDTSGAPSAALRSLSSGTGSRVTSATMRCAGKMCRGVLAAAGDAGLALSAFEAPLDKGAPPTRRPLTTLPGRGISDAALQSLEAQLSSILFVHEQRGIPARLRLLRLLW